MTDLEQLNPSKQILCCYLKILLYLKINIFGNQCLFAWFVAQITANVCMALTNNENKFIGSSTNFILTDFVLINVKLQLIKTDVCRPLFLCSDKLISKRK